MRSARRARPLRARPTPNVAIMNAETPRRAQGSPGRPIVSRETRARSGQVRSVASGEHEPVGHHDEELPPHAGDDCRLERDAAAALQQVRLQRLGDDRAGRQAEHHRLDHEPDADEGGRSAGAPRGGAKERHQATASIRVTARFGRRRRGSRRAERAAPGRGRGRGPRSAARRRRDPRRAGPAGSREAWRRRRFIGRADPPWSRRRRGADRPTSAPRRGRPGGSRSGRGRTAGPRAGSGRR